MPPIAPLDLRSASLKFKIHRSAHLLASGFLLRTLFFGHPSWEKSPPPHARSTGPAGSPSPRGFDFAPQLILPVDVSRREMKRPQPRNAGVLCEHARLRGG